MHSLPKMRLSLKTPLSNSTNSQKSNPHFSNHISSTSTQPSSQSSISKSSLTHQSDNSLLSLLSLWLNVSQVLHRRISLCSRTCSNKSSNSWLTLRKTLTKLGSSPRKVSNKMVMRKKITLLLESDALIDSYHQSVNLSCCHWSESWWLTQSTSKPTIGGTSTPASWHSVKSESTSTILKKLRLWFPLLLAIAKTQILRLDTLPSTQLVKSLMICQTSSKRHTHQPCFQWLSHA